MPPRISVAVTKSHSPHHTPKHAASPEKDGHELALTKMRSVKGNLSEEEQVELANLEREERRRKGVQLGQYMTYVKGEVDRETSCLELPMTIVLLFSFACLALMHLKQDKVFAVEGAIKFDIEENANFAWSHNFGHKTIHDVNSIADFWSWLHLGFLPLIVQHSWGYSEDLQAAYTSLNDTHPYSTGSLPGQYGWPMDEEAICGDKACKTEAVARPQVQIPVRDDLLHYNRIVGGIRVRQERAEASFDLCRFPTAVPTDLWQQWLGKPCMPADPQYRQTPEAGDAEIFGTPARVEWLFTGIDSLQQLQQKVVDMEDGCQQLAEKSRSGACLCQSCSDGTFTGPWLDERTQRIEIALVTYNAEYGLLSLTTATFFFSRGGMIHKFVHGQSSWADHFAGAFLDVAFMVMCDLLWIFLLFYLFVNEVVEIFKTCKSSKDHFWRAILDDYLDHWNVVDWVSMGFATFCVVMFVQLFLETNKVTIEFEKITGLDFVTMDRKEAAVINDKFFSMMEDLCAVERWYRQSFCFYPMAVMLRLFKSFAAQGRLAIVTRTLGHAAIDMIHFFLVFFSVYFCMTVNAVLIFGQDIEAYSDLPRATLTVFRAMFGDWDWSAMDEGTLWVSAVWFWLFVMVMMVILLNFLLAILMDSYAVVKEKSMNEEPLMKQIDTMMRRRSENKAKERVRLGDIYQTYYKEVGDDKTLLSDKTVITPDDVLKKVPDIKRKQATRTMQGAKELTTGPQPAVPEPEYTMQDVKNDLDWLNKRTQTVRDTVEDVRRMTHKYDHNLDHKTTSEFLKKPLPPRTQIVNTVRSEINQLGPNISGTLLDEVEIFTQQHRDLETQNRNMLAQMEDTHRVMATIRAQTDLIRHDTQKQAILQRRAHTMAQFEAGRPEPIGIAACMAPAAEAAPHRPR